jgi:hypothetical protein
MEAGSRKTKQMWVQNQVRFYKREKLRVKFFRSSFIADTDTIVRLLFTSTTQTT